RHRDRRVVPGEYVARRVADENQVDAGRVEDRRGQIVVSREACDRLALRLHFLKTPGRDLTWGVDAHRLPSFRLPSFDAARPDGSNGTAARRPPHGGMWRCSRELLEAFPGPAAPLRVSASIAGMALLSPVPRTRSVAEGGMRAVRTTGAPGGEMNGRFAAWLLAAASSGAMPLVLAQGERGPDDEALVHAAASADEWLTYGRDYAETRFSPLDQIDERTVSRLGLAWTYETGSVRGHEATPLISDGVLYASTSWSNVFALDARTGEEVWFWDSKADRARGSRACCDVVNRGVALYD